MGPNSCWLDWYATIGWIPPAEAAGPVCAVNSSVCVAVHRWMRRCIKKHKLQLTSFFATSADEADLQTADAAKLDLSAVPVSLHRTPRWDAAFTLNQPNNWAAAGKLQTLSSSSCFCAHPGEHSPLSFPLFAPYECSEGGFGSIGVTCGVISAPTSTHSTPSADLW